MKILLKGIILFLPFFSNAEIGLPPVDLKPGQFVEGSIFSVKYVPGDKEVSFYVVGKKKAGVQFSPSQTVLEVNGQRYPLEQNASKAFVYSSPLKSGAVLKVEKSDGKSEEFHLKNP